MNARHFAILACLGSLALPPASADEATQETIVMVRHGEKPEKGLGQLNCQGLNRALALPRVIEAKYGRPDAIYAPDPSKQKNDRGTGYDYVRPLATIEPTAIYFGMPVHASMSFKNIDKLVDTLLSPNHRNELIVVAWEHTIIEQAAREIVAQYGGDASNVPKWQSPDFDSIYVVRVARRAGKTTASFEVDHQGLNNQPSVCPGG
jgi:hypothetical protein